ncbi:IS200/IS605 family accessory protein TnpB-related protein [Nonomuraea sp. NPDC052116]|uniref:IS200/IS605 family accessory protein TnpB-related protein n=1 Tax=Nonomuraea sp. NPDC052116 TaxID=3155665 RepID=UPI0034347AE5
MRAGKGLRPIAAPFTVAGPAGARIRDRLRLSAGDIEVLTAVGGHLGGHARADLAERIRIGDVTAAHNRRAERKKRLTAVASSRWAGAMTRASEDQYRLSLRSLRDQRAVLRHAIAAIRRRLAVGCGQRQGRVRGYADQEERWHKQRRLQVLTGRLARVEYRIKQGRPAIVVGGRRLVKARHHLADAELTEQQWRRRWEARRLFLTADGETGAPFGNYTITVDPGDGSVTIVLPEPLRHLANAPRGRYRLAGSVRFHHRREQWLDRVQAHRAVRYDIAQDPARDRWYLDASWSAETPTLPSTKQLAASGARLLGVDLNADHLAACVIDACGNPIGEPITIPTALAGPAAQRDGRLRQAISDLIRIARQHGCAGIAIENLGFDDARNIGRESLGRGRRGKAFRRTVAGIPTARFRERLRGMACHRGLVVIAVDPAYTSKWGGQHWHRPLQQQAKQSTATRHHAAAVAIARRAFGHAIRRRPGVTVRHQRMAVRRATGQAVSLPKVQGATRPPRTVGTSHEGGKTCRGPGGQLAQPPAPKTVRGAPGPGSGPGHGDPASAGDIA